MPTLRIYSFAEADRPGFAELHHLGGARDHMLGDRTELGRSLGSAVHLPEPTIGRHHATHPSSAADEPVLEDIPAPARETRHRLQVFEVDAAPREQLLTGELVVGRGSPSGLQLRSSGVSRRHCRFFVVDGCCFVEDLGSTHGTRVEGRPIAGPCALAHGARVLLQDVLLVYCEAGRPSPPRHGPP